MDSSSFLDFIKCVLRNNIFIPSKNKTDDEGYDSDLNSISIDNEKITLATTKKEGTIDLLQKLPSGEFSQLCDNLEYVLSSTFVQTIFFIF